MDDRKIIEFPGQNPVIRTSVKEELIIDQLKQVMPTVAMFTQGLYNYCTLLDANTDPAELANNKKDRLSTKLHNAANYVNEAIRILDGLIDKSEQALTTEEAEKSGEKQSGFDVILHGKIVAHCDSADIPSEGITNE